MLVNAKWKNITNLSRNAEPAGEKNFEAKSQYPVKIDHCCAGQRRQGQIDPAPILPWRMTPPTEAFEEDVTGALPRRRRHMVTKETCPSPRGLPSNSNSEINTFITNLVGEFPFGILFFLFS